jgi:CubicO group peptidase (beta-lactamase class C family)
MRREIGNGVMAGAVTLVARHGQVVHFEAHGYLDAKRTVPMPKDALFRIASMTKPIVSAATMMLVEQGKLKLSDPIARWLPELKDVKVLAETADAAGHTTRDEVPAARPISVYDLLRHTSGFCYTDNAPFAEIGAAYSKADIESVNSDVPPDEFLRRLASIPLAWQPGTRWQYGISIDVLGVLLERVTQQRLDVWLADVIFKPLHMRDTTFQVLPDRAGRLADALDSDPGKAQSWKESRVDADPARRFRQAGSGIVSTAEDYFRFAKMILNGGEIDGVRLLSRKTVQLMLSDHIPTLDGPPYTGPGYGFGLGFAVRRQDGGAFVPGSRGDANWSGAYGTTFTIDPSEEVVGIFMAQAPSQGSHLRFLFKDLVYAAIAK